MPGKLQNFNAFCSYHSRFFPLVLVPPKQKLGISKTLFNIFQSSSDVSNCWRMLCFLVSFAIKLLDITHIVYHKRRTAGRLSRYSPLSHRARGNLSQFTRERFFTRSFPVVNQHRFGAPRDGLGLQSSPRSFPSTRDVAH